MTAALLNLNSYQLEIGAAADAPISVVVSPQQTVLSLLGQAITKRQRGAPPGLLQSIRRSLQPASRFALQPMASTLDRHAIVLDCSAPVVPDRDVTVQEQVERLRDLPDQVLRADLDAELEDSECGEAIARTWQEAVDEPRRWYESMASATEDTWSATALRWHRARPLFERETRRVGVAVVRGQTDVLLNSLHHSFRFDGEVMHLMRECTRDTIPLEGRRLILLPMLGGRDAVFASFELPDVAFLAYPLPGTDLLDSGEAVPPASEDALSLIVGPARSAALRALDRPLTAGQLAVALQCAPNTATYHCEQLETAGLVIRQRQRQTVEVSRTLRGTQLVELLS
jgi:DNA-binding transcriptional ArsR family regulator